MATKVIVVKGEAQKLDVPADSIVVVMKLEDTVSGSGKMRLLGCTHGNQATESEYEGKTIYANCNVGTFLTPKK